MCSSLFLTLRLQRGSDGHLRCIATLIDPLEPWLYKFLCSAVALQRSAKNRSGTSVYLVSKNYKRLFATVVLHCVCTQLNNQTVLFQTIHFSISHLFAFSLNVKQFYLTS